MHSAGPPAKNSNKQAIIIIVVLMSCGATCFSALCCFNLSPLAVMGLAGGAALVQQDKLKAAGAPSSPQEAATRWLNDYRAAGTLPSNTSVVIQHKRAEATMFTPGTRVSWHIDEQTNTSASATLRGPESDPRAVSAKLRIGPPLNGYPIPESELTLTLDGAPLPQDKSWPAYPVKGGDPKDIMALMRKSGHAANAILAHYLKKDLAAIHANQAAMDGIKYDDAALSALVNPLHDLLADITLNTANATIICPVLPDEDDKITRELWASGRSSQQCTLVIPGQRPAPQPAKGKKAKPQPGPKVTFKIDAHLVFKLNAQQQIDVYSGLGAYQLTED